MDVPIGSAELSRRNKVTVDDIFPRNVQAGLRIAKHPTEYLKIIEEAKESDRQRALEKLKKAQKCLEDVKERLKSAKGNSLRPALVPKHWKTLFRFGDELLHPVKFPFKIAPTETTIKSWNNNRSLYSQKLAHTKKQILKVADLTSSS
jgi:hypothetical protein